jgi:hypothetical protein
MGLRGSCGQKAASECRDTSATFEPHVQREPPFVGGDHRPDCSKTSQYSSARLCQPEYYPGACRLEATDPRYAEEFPEGEIRAYVSTVGCLTLMKERFRLSFQKTRTCPRIPNSPCPQVGYDYEMTAGHDKPWPHNRDDLREARGSRVRFRFSLELMTLATPSGSDKIEALERVRNSSKGFSGPERHSPKPIALSRLAVKITRRHFGRAF